MTDQDHPNQPNEDLRQALMRLTSPHYENLQVQIDSLLSSLETIKTQLTYREHQVEQQTQDLQSYIKETREKLNQLESSLGDLDQGVHSEILPQFSQFSRQLDTLQVDINDPQLVSERMKPVFVPTLQNAIQTEPDEFAHAVSPVIGPAIRYQIRESRQDIIDSLYPIIGQIIGKAIAEALREITRNIDRRMRRQFDLRSQMRRLIGRVRGVSEAEILLRESLPYNVQHIFLIHRETGILLQHLSGFNQQVEDADIVSSMLTAIRDFVSDSFGGDVGELEEITHGDRRFLIESGLYAYLAVIVEGVEPRGYYGLIDQNIHEINLKYEAALRNFNGEMDSLPDFTDDLSPLLAPEQALLKDESPLKPMSSGQKWTLAGILAGIGLLLGFSIFACIFTVRLWPFAFPGPTASPTITQTAPFTPTTTATTTPSNTATLAHSPTQTLTITPITSAAPSVTTSPTYTPTIQPTPVVQIVILMGNLYVRSGPSIHNPSLGVIYEGESAIMLEKQGDWVHVQWPIEGETILDGWLWGQFVTIESTP